MYTAQPTISVHHEAIGEVQSDAPKGAASPSGNNQQNIRSTNQGAIVADAARSQAMSQSHILDFFEIALAFALTVESGSGAIVIRSKPKKPATIVPPAANTTH